MAGEDVASPLAWARSATVDAWRTLKTVYYADSLSWRFLKGGALVFLGFFLWAGSNLLLSYRPGWEWLTYPMAYGFVVLVYGPIHHAVVIPLALRWRRAGGTKTRVGRRLPTAMLAVFLTVVVVLGTVPAGPMVFDFKSSLASTGADIDPDIHCTRSTGANGTVVHCHLTESSGVDHVLVQSGGRTLTRDDAPPFEFEVRGDQLTTVTGQRQFQVLLKDEQGNTLRRYSRTLAMIEEG